MNTRPTAEIDLQRLTKRLGAVSHAQRSRIGSGVERALNAVVASKERGTLNVSVGLTPDGHTVGYHSATGVQSIFKQHFLSNGVQLPDLMFTLTAQPPAEKLD